MSLILTILLSFAVTAIAMAAMAIGVMAGRRPIRGTCGGLNGAACELCSGRCRQEAD